MAPVLLPHRSVACQDRPPEDPRIRLPICSPPVVMEVPTWLPLRLGSGTGRRRLVACPSRPVLTLSPPNRSTPIPAILLHTPLPEVYSQAPSVPITPCRGMNLPMALQMQTCAGGHGIPPRILRFLARPLAVSITTKPQTHSRHPSTHQHRENSLHGFRGLRALIRWFLSDHSRHRSDGPVPCRWTTRISPLLAIALGEGLTMRSHRFDHRRQFPAPVTDGVMYRGICHCIRT